MSPLGHCLVRDSPWFADAYPSFATHVIATCGVLCVVEVVPVLVPVLVALLSVEVVPVLVPVLVALLSVKVVPVLVASLPVVSEPVVPVPVPVPVPVAVSMLSSVLVLLKRNHANTEADIEDEQHMKNITAIIRICVLGGMFDVTLFYIVSFLF